MCMYGVDHEYANSRLSETIVRRNGVPVYIHNVRRGMKTQYSPLDDFNLIEEDHLDAFDLQPVPLGYCNYNKNASYLCRIPMRRDWRQGLRRGNFCAQGGNVDGSRIPYEVLHQVIIGDYPTFKGVLEAIRKIKSCAWHRHWSVNSGLEVFYKGGVRPVGIVENGEVVLSSRYLYLSEALKEAL